jgi:hypothetical protein
MGEAWQLLLALRSPCELLDPLRVRVRHTLGVMGYTDGFIPVSSLSRLSSSLFTTLKSRFRVNTSPQLA